MFQNLFVEQMFGGTIPVEVEQKPRGQNDIYQAKATIFTYLIDLDRQSQITDEDWYVLWEVALKNMTIKFNEQTKHVKFRLLSVGLL